MPTSELVTDLLHFFIHHRTPTPGRSQLLQLIPCLFLSQSLQEVKFLVKDDRLPLRVPIDPTAAGGPEGGGDGEDAGFQSRRVSMVT